MADKSDAVNAIVALHKYLGGPDGFLAGREDGDNDPMVASPDFTIEGEADGTVTITIDGNNENFTTDQLSLIGKVIKSVL